MNTTDIEETILSNEQIKSIREFFKDNRENLAELLLVCLGHYPKVFRVINYNEPNNIVVEFANHNEASENQILVAEQQGHKYLSFSLEPWESDKTKFFISIDYANHFDNHWHFETTYYALRIPVELSRVNLQLIVVTLLNMAGIQESKDFKRREIQ